MLPTYLAIGMTTEEFWHGDPRLARAYREADSIRRERESVHDWKLGQYALAAMLAAANAYREFGAGPEHPYPEEPLFMEERLSEVLREQQEKRRMESMRARFEGMAEAVGIALEKRERGEGTAPQEQ